MGGGMEGVMGGVMGGEMGGMRNMGGFGDMGGMVGMGGGYGSGAGGGMESRGFGNFNDMDSAEREFMMGGKRVFGKVSSEGIPSLMDGMGHGDTGGGMGGVEAMGGGGMGAMDGMGNAAMQGRKLLIDGLTESISDLMVSRYFQKFGELVDWGRDKSGEG